MKIKEEKEAEKSLVNVLGALPDLLAMEQTRLLLKAALVQVGTDLLPAMWKMVRKMGLMNVGTSLLSFRMGNIMPYLVTSLFETFGDKDAIIVPEQDKRFTYREYRERILRLANGMQGLGLKLMDRVALLLRNGNEYAECFWADSFIGVINLNMNWHLREKDLLEVLRRQNPKAVIFDEEFMEIATKAKNEIKSIEHFIMAGEKAPEGMIAYEDLLSRSSDEMPETNFLMSVSPFTGGTTGVPKAVNYYDYFSALSDVVEGPRGKIPFKEVLRETVRTMSYAYLDALNQPNLRTLQPTPMFHAGTMTGWLLTLFFGGTLVMMRTFDPEEMIRLIEKERIMYVFVVPTTIQRILALPDEVKRRYDLSSMYTLLCAAAPCPPEFKKDINELFIQQNGRPVFAEYYASTEDGAAHFLLPKDYLEDPKRYESCGKSGRTSDTIIFDKEKGEICPPNTEGSVFVYSMGSLSLRYKGAPEERTRDALRIIDGKPYFDEELTGQMDEDGFLYLTGRTKDMIIPGGVNIFPDEIEKVITRDPKVADVAVIPIPDKDLGEAVGAVVQLKEGKSATEEEIIEHCKKEGLYGYKVPKKVDFWKELPRTFEGKMIKRNILPEYWEDKGIKRRG